MIMMFDTSLAKEYGLLESVILQNIFFWISKNKANEQNFFDGKYWTYNSVKAFTEQFEFASKDQIYRALKKLEDKGVIYTGCYNQSNYDRTKWYALSDSVFNYLSGNKYDSDENTEVQSEKQKPKKNFKEDIEKIVNYLNEVLHTDYKAKSKYLNTLVRARLEEDFTVEDFKTVIDKKYKEWGNNAKMVKYLRPITLFSPTHFESYLNEKTASEVPRYESKPEEIHRQTEEELAEAKAWWDSLEDDGDV